jgi:DNA repair protein RecO (recombination protein O)
MRIALQPAFILHARAYRETSLLLDIFTPEYGRVSLVARGVRTQRSKLRAILQPFSPLLISWQGKTELMTMLTAEPQGVPLPLHGECLLSGFYLNELLLRLLQKQDPHPQLYTIYHHTLLELTAVKLEQKFLRVFEKKLLDELGYGLPLKADFLPEQLYWFHPEQGFTRCERADEEPSSRLFIGKSLLALATEKLDDPDVLRDVKRLMRIALSPLLGHQPLHSRKLFSGVLA